MSNLNKIIETIRRDYSFIISDLKLIQSYASDYGYTDVRLCVDMDDQGSVSWIIRSGSSDYDQRHSMYCGASSIQIDQDVIDPLESMIDQVMDQAADHDSVNSLEAI